MKPNNTKTPRAAVTSLAGAVISAMLLWLGSATPASAVPELSLIGGTGAPGGTVAVTLQLSGDTENVAVSADQDVGFPTDSLEFFPPVTMNCAIDPRLADTHSVSGRLSSAGVLALTVALQGTPPPPLPTLGDGPLASCDFHILAGVPTGTVAVTISDPCLGNADGTCVEVETANGSVLVSNATPTSTPTLTPIPPTATVTGVVTGTATATVTVTQQGTPTNTPATTGVSTPTNTPTGGGGTATATKTPGTPGTSTPTATATGPTPTRTGAPATPADNSDCRIVPVEQSSPGGTLVLLLGPALLVWARRRRF